MHSRTIRRVAHRLRGKDAARASRMLHKLSRRQPEAPSLLGRRVEVAADGRALAELGSRTSPDDLVVVYVCRFVRYISTMAIEAVLQEVLKMPAEERAELVEHLIDSLDDDQVELSAEELAQLDEAIADAGRAAERGELIPADAVLAQMRQIS